jgi:hypothetical protein
VIVKFVVNLNVILYCYVGFDERGIRII